ncbi:peptidase M4 [Corallococcus sp. H22C18031201]|uniref:M4 family metallopeptidase n=1 Tax=Citreicoccus inhibens TaxID=2849499 RepID=UPI000E74159B|nr:M4 family metallopeptidase [Citreicoccus inhibens]MBU8895083.1 M4 family metallopeptidase [Citreicoccus inhibens]RJS27230.1 peptidase M4 [Corallococcus sp. H22C18031201]
MKRSTRWLAASLSCSLLACGAEAPADAKGSRDVGVALAALPGVEVVGTHQDGVPFMLRGLMGDAGRPLPGATAWQAHGLLSPTLARVAPVFRLDPKDLLVQRVNQDEEGRTHVRYAQTKHGLPVVNQELIVHLDAQGRVYAVNGDARDDGEDVSAEPRLDAATARDAALKNTVGEARVEGEPRLVYVRPAEDGPLTLAYEVEVRGDGDEMPVQDRVYVSAKDGAEVQRISGIHGIKDRSVCSVSGVTKGTCRTDSPVVPPIGDPIIDKAFDNLGLFYDCFYFNYGRDSVNGVGGKLRLNVHGTTTGCSAYYDVNNIMTCSDGDGVTCGPMCSDPDTVVHEFTHGITSGLTYSGESLSLSESYSDIYAAVCESWATGLWSLTPDVWKIDEDVWTPAIAGDALRYMDDPTLDGVSKDYYPDIFGSGTPNYNAGSGVPNLAFKLLATGGTHPHGKTTVSVAAIGAQAAGRIFYRALTNYFTATTNMLSAKAATHQAAVDLGYSTAIQDSVTHAWEAVGVPAPITCAKLANGITVTNISGAAGTQKYYCLDVPAGKPASFAMGGGTGDPDLYVRFGTAPTSTAYDCRPYTNTSTESCTIAAHATAGTYWVMISGFSAYSGVSLTGSY